MQEMREMKAMEAKLRLQPRRRRSWEVWRNAKSIQTAKRANNGKFVESYFCRKQIVLTTFNDIDLCSYGEHCIRPTSSCVPGSAGCRCDSNDACEAEHECKNLPDVKLNVCLRKDVKKLAGMLISPNSTDGNAIG